MRNQAFEVFFYPIRLEIYRQFGIELSTLQRELSQQLHRSGQDTDLKKT